MAPLADSYEQVNFEVVKQPGLTVRTKTFEGPAEKLLSAALAESIGLPASDRYSEIANLGNRISGVIYRRMEGDTARLTVQAQTREPVEFWQLSWQQVQKPIRTWNADAANAADRPDLTKLAQWEATEGKNNNIDYSAFRYYDDDSATPSTLTGATLKLAQKIYRGVETYALYTPVITKVSKLDSTPTDTGNVGTIGTPSSAEGATVAGDASQPAKYTALAASWLKTDDSQQTHEDGSVTRTEQWIGADAWDPDLYPTTPGA